MENSKQKLINANQLRLKYTKLDLLINQALKLSNLEENHVLDRALKILKPIQKELDEEIKEYLTEMQEKTTREDSSTSAGLRIKPIYKKRIEKNIEASVQADIERDIYSQNPFEFTMRTDNLSNSLMEVREKQTHNLLGLAQKVQSLLTGNISNETSSEASEVAGNLLQQLFKSKAMLELAQTKEEVSISDNEFICIVHKGPVRGGAYICPHCKAIYCFKCANALKQQGETCWSCNHDYYIDLV